MKSKICIPHILLTVFCFAGLQILLFSVFSLLDVSENTKHSWTMSYPSCAMVGFVSAGLITTFSREIHIVNIGLAGFSIALLQVVLPYGRLGNLEILDGIRPLSNSLSVSTMYLVGAIIGARLSKHWHSRVSPDNLTVHIALALMTFLGAIHLNIVAVLNLWEFPESSLLWIVWFLSLPLYPISTGYLVQRCSPKPAEISLFFSFTLIIIIVFSWCSELEGMAAGAAAAFACAIILTIYYVLAWYGIALANRQREKDSAPNIPSATAIQT